MKRSLITGGLLFMLIFFSPARAFAQNLRQALESELEKKGIPGISLTVLHKGKIETTVAGMADPDLGVPLESRHRMLSGSAGKTFFAALIMQLVEEGTLDLEARAAQYLGEESWFRQLPNAKTMTIKHLMNHTSGLPEYVYANALWQRLKANPAKTWTPTERLAFLAGKEPLFSVGEGFAYADANYILLGIIVEKVTGRDIYQLVQERFLDPLALQQTEPATQSEMEQLTAAYSGRLFGQLFGEKIAQMGQYSFNPQVEWTGGGFVTNARDLAVWAKHFYEGALFSPTAHEQVFSPVDRQTGKSGKQTGYGLGVEIFATSYGVAYGHTGFMPGYQSLMAYLPDYDLAIAFQINTDPYASRVQGRFSMFDLLEVILPHHIKRHKAYKKKTRLYLVRHAEKADDGTRDPNLNTQGKERAKQLATLLQNKKIDAICSTAYKRTIQTGQPLARLLGQSVRTYPVTNTTHVFDFIANHQGQNILVVGHSNTIPAMVNWLLGKEELEQLAEYAYGDLFVVSHKKGKAKLEKSKF